jgi:hypothetical protein
MTAVNFCSEPAMNYCSEWTFEENGEFLDKFVAMWSIPIGQLFKENPEDENLVRQSFQVSLEVLWVDVQEVL